VRAAVVVGGLTAAFHLVTAGIWGFHRDEFYYLACGRRLAWGYVDHPPITPALYRIQEALFGASQLGLRVAPALIHGAIVVVTAMLAKEFGAGPHGQLLAALCAAVCPMFLTTGHFLGTVTFEVLSWAVASLLVAKLVHGADPRFWLAVGLTLGIGLLNKWTVTYLIVALGAGLLLTSAREVLFTPWVLAGAAIALLLWAPNLAWQAAHGWPAFEFASQIRDYGETLLTAPYQLVFTGAAALLVIPGLIRTPERWLTVAFVVLVIVVMATGGKPYYAGPLLPALIGAGAVFAESWRPGPTFAAIGVLAVAAAPFSMPLTPESTVDRLASLNPELGEMLGWDRIVAQVEEVAAEHRGATVLTANYSQAGAIELWAPELRPLSGQLTYWYWAELPPGRSDTTIVYGYRDPAYLERFWSDVERIGTVGPVPGQDDGAGIYLARGQRMDWADMWPELRRF